MNFWKKIKKPILVLAPMAGYTDSAFRLLCKENGADVVYTEMISADALYYDSKKTLEMLKFNKKEKPIVCQLFGKRPEVFPKACKIVEKAGYSGIDINFGCPARKVVRHGGGVTLMKDLNKCHEIIKTVINSSKLPVSVKIRKSINQAGETSTSRLRKNKITALDFLKKIKDLDVKAVMIHGRTYEKPFEGEIDYKIIKQARKYFKGIIIANGGIDSVEQAQITLKKTGADGLGLARGLFGKPWLFRDVKDNTVGTYHGMSLPDIHLIKTMAIRHAELLYKTKGKKGMFEIRKHLIFYTKGLPNAKILREKLVRVESVKEIKKILNKL
jgi:nifR3 family TIM-barrel protein